MARAPGAPRVSPTKVAYHSKQLAKMVSRSGDAEFFQLVWATDALQSQRVQQASQFITFPPEAADHRVNSPLAIHRWELETLVVQALLTPKQEFREGPNLVLDCSRFDSIREAINRLRALENVEAGLYLADEQFNIFGEMHRIAQRQFHWQQGYFNLPQFYRYLFIYGQGRCAEYFRQQHGLSTSEFALAAVSYFASYQRTPWLGRNEAPQIGLTREILDRAIPLIAIEHGDARAQSAADVARINEQHGRPVPTAYLPSVLRRTPLIFQRAQPNLFIAPIPEVIVMRVTSGLYYDLIPGGQALLNETNDRFEQYCCQYLATMMPRFDVQRAASYIHNGAQFDTPDILVRDAGRLSLVAECKATKLTYLAQFAEDPFDAQRRQYQQISRGIFQLWRFRSHVRRELINIPVAANCYALVLTLDPFAVMHAPLRAAIFDEAHRLANQEGQILDEDRQHVVICPVAAFEQVLHRSNEDTLLTSFAIAREPRYIDWQFREVHRQIDGEHTFGPPRPFPFDLGELLPWWTAVERLARERASGG